jgi:hypothetical protein
MVVNVYLFMTQSGNFWIHHRRLMLLVYVTVFTLRLMETVTDVRVIVRGWGDQCATYGMYQIILSWCRGQKFSH